MDQLLNSLLVRHGKDLIPASSALALSSSQTHVERDATLQDDGALSEMPARHHAAMQLHASGAHDAAAAAADPRSASADGEQQETQGRRHADAAFTLSRDDNTLARHRFVSSRSTTAQMAGDGMADFDLPASGQSRGDFEQTDTFDFDDDDEPLQVMSMEEYDQLYPYSPPSNKPPRATSASLRSDDNAGSHTAAFYQTCAERGLQPSFSYKEVAIGCFDVVLVVDGQLLGELGPYASKKAAKNEICKHFLSKLSTFAGRRSVKSEDGNAAYAQLFNQACQEYGVRPEFCYTEVSKGLFEVALKINAEVVSQLGLFASKKDAKNEICRHFLPRLEGYGCNKKRRNSELPRDMIKERKISDPLDTTDIPPDTVDDEEWVGILYNYTQTQKLPPPKFDIQGSHPTNGPWTCQVTLSTMTTPILATPSARYKRKDDAKKVAAMECVMSLRQQGLLPKHSSFHNPSSKPSIRKSEARPELPQEGHTGLSQTMQDNVEINAPPQKPDKPVGAQVHAVALSLGFQQPEFRTNLRDGAFLDMWAVFSLRDTAREPRLAGEVGRVNHIHGKKSAKEECWREVLKVLEEIERSRLAGA